MLPSRISELGARHSKDSYLRLDLPLITWFIIVLSLDRKLLRTLNKRMFNIAEKRLINTNYLAQQFLGKKDIFNNKLKYGKLQRHL